MKLLFFLISVFLVTAGHFFRTQRWKSLLSVYEEASFGTLLKAAALGYFTDMLIPFHAGDLVKAAVTGRKLTNRTAFAMATIFIDRLLDVAIVAILYGIFYLFQDKSCLPWLIFYSIGTMLLLLLLFWSMTFSRHVKKTVLFISSIFNEKIQLWLLCFFWSCICTFQNIIHKLKRFLLLGRTLCMWLCYMGSYLFLSKALEQQTLLSVFNIMFAPTSTSAAADAAGGKISCFVLLYYVVSCLILFLLSLIAEKITKKVPAKVPELTIPYVSASSRLDFLQIYFSDVRSKQDIDDFLTVNKNVTILKNCSAGSNATTLLCIRDNEMLFRKYAFGADGEKLYAQVQWLQENATSISVTDICFVKKKEQFCCYDMPYLNNSVSFFDFIHSASSEKTWAVLMQVLQDLEHSYETHRKALADEETIEKYINTKAIENLKKIFAFPPLAQLNSYPELSINGICCKNFSCFEQKLTSAAFWKKIFCSDYYSDIHGDLTIENIIFNSSYPKSYYLIDPNGGNIHDSPNLDYAKLLQSLHGGYEFLMHTPKVTVTDNQISFQMTRSSAYDILYDNLKEYLFRTFGRERTRSIYFHEIIHWFRLMPYKINHDSNRAVMFYAGMMLVINDIFCEFGEELSEL